LHHVIVGDTHLTAARIGNLNLLVLGQRVVARQRTERQSQAGSGTHEMSEASAHPPFELAVDHDAS
jgi:hypothetical protein